MAACLLVLAALVPSGFGQQGLENMLFSAGTVTRDAGARDWAYLLWQSSTPALVQGKSFAIYAKPGAANAAGSYTRKAVVTLHTDPLVIAPLLNRAANLGDNLTELDSAMGSLFQSILPAGLLTPAEKLSAIIRGSEGDPDREK
ncbi:MAG TPA: hypothetical protein VNM37_10775, partial [Candidatus Dormibacteraeota bacterium]|nr:hypothetical protein [Candidatus Dormibacteraeota bacterium]